MAANDFQKQSDALTLRDILGGELTMVIPDMQRDYCWGTDGYSAEQPKEKVSDFLRNIIQLYQHNHTTPLGLLYGYHNPQQPHHIHIIDGQQRLTTLYLLLGMLYRRDPSDWLRRLLISDYKLIDDHEPRLLYQVRTDAMYFMSDLVTNFFLNRDGRLSQLEKSPWYYNCYDSDPTVKSFVSAIRHIDAVLEEASKRCIFDFVTFTEFVVDNLTFIYHDLGSPQTAQKMFVTINTTGEPLTTPQTLKLSIVASDTNSQMGLERWEEIESWAWRHRLSHDSERPVTSDRRMECILSMWSNMCTLTDTKEDISGNIEGLYDFFLKYRRLTEEVPEALDYEGVSAQQQFILLPTIAYIQRWSNATPPIEHHDIENVWNYLKNISRYQKATASGSDTRAAISMVKHMPDRSLLSLLEMEGVSERVLNAEERTKLRFLAVNGDNERTRAILELGQSHPLLNGRMARVIQWTTNGRTNVTDLKTLEKYIDLIYKVWGTDISRNPDLDTLRRALLTFNDPGYPIVRRGDTNVSFCWNDYDWQRLMTNSPDLIRRLLDKVKKYKIGAQEALEDIARRNYGGPSPYNLFTMDAPLLQRCNRRSIMLPCPPFIGYYENDGDDDKKSNAANWIVGMIPIKIDLKEWSPIRQYGARCLYTDHRYYNVSIDLYYTPSERNDFRLEIFSRAENEGSRASLYFTPFLKEFSLQYDEGRKRYYMTFNHPAKAASYMNLALKLLPKK